MRYLYFIFIFTTSIYSLDFKVASYNVENFFDLHNDTTEYREFIPHTKTWNANSFRNKLKNVSKTLKDLDADILALQEVESQKVIDALITKNPQYKYYAFYKNKNSAIGLALLSKYKIISYSNIKINNNEKYSRDILKVHILIDNKPLIIYVNHWRSKRAPESKRIEYALTLKKDIDKEEAKDYIIIGDLNSNYNEYKSFKYEKKLNDSFGITGINQILNTTIQENYVHKNNIFKYNENVHYNTWLELGKKERYSVKFKNINNTPDNILLSANLFDSDNISYIDKSFNVFRPKYLFKKNQIYRWNKSKKNGYSDHLPIFASFSTSKQKYNFKNQKLTDSQTKYSIQHIYDVEQISNYIIKNAIVIYKSKEMVIVKQVNNRAILIYKPSINFKIGYSYDFTIDKIDEYNGLKEITSISNTKKNLKFNTFKELYLDGNKIDLNNEKYINEIIYNIEGIYKNNYLYFNNTKIRLYFKKSIKKPENGVKISIFSGHLSIYKSFMQIVLHKRSDFKVL